MYCLTHLDFIFRTFKVDDYVLVKDGKIKTPAVITEVTINLMIVCLHSISVLNVIIVISWQINLHLSLVLSS